MKFCTRIIVFFLMPLLCILFFSPYESSAQQEEKEDTYAISLVQTAEVDKNIVEVDDKKVLIEDYTIKKGDHLWQLLRERGLLKKKGLPEVLAVLRKLNKSLSDLNLIHPGDKIIIPLTIAPMKGMSIPTRRVVETPVSIEELKEMDLDNYTIKSGDTLVKVIKGLFKMPEKFLYHDYLGMVKKLNPSIENLNMIYPGQIVRLPIYSPQIVRLPIKTSQPPEPVKGETKPAPEEVKQVSEEVKADLITLSRQLGEIVNQMGEEWVQTGQHFIPLKSGGQINLKADTYPIINLSNGNRVIVDVHHVLPEEMARLIVSNWENYKIVNLTQDDTLRSAFGRILQACGYYEVHKYGEPLELAGDIPIQITADWIIKRVAGSPDGKGKMIMITITDSHASETPREIKDYLENLGIIAIDYPSADKPVDEPGYKVEILKASQNKTELVKMLLNLTGWQFGTDIEIPIYRQEGTDYNLVIKADFYMVINGRESIIDVTGLGPEIISLLREHKFSVISFSQENDPSVIGQQRRFKKYQNHHTGHNFSGS